mgnify:CR=1 FL=1
MFVDRAFISIKAGDGGNGVVKEATVIDVNAEHRGIRAKCLEKRNGG